MDKEIEDLLIIQSIDIRLDEIQKEKEKIPKKIEKLKENLDLLSTVVEQDLSTIEELKKARRTVERELEEIESKFQKSRLRLNDVKSNKEYQAVLKEIEELKGLIFEKEETVIRCMEDIEIQEKDCTSNTRALRESQEELKKKQEEFSERMKDMDKEVESLHGERTELCQNVDKNLLERYNRLRKNLAGKVITQVIKTICQGCNLGIPPQQYNELIKGTSIQSCPHCDRIIYWTEEREI